MGKFFKRVLFIYCSILLGNFVSAEPINFLEQIPESDAWQRLPDPIQDRNTTSLDISGLVERVKLPESKTVKKKEGLRILIDIGHGGKDAGAKGWYRLVESELCLKVGKAVKRELEKNFAKFAKYKNAKVVLSRGQDKFLSLHERVEMANRWNADIFVSLHANSSPVDKVHGFEVYFLAPEATDEAAKNLAKKENSEAAKITDPIQSMLHDAQASNHINVSSQLAEAIYGQMSLLLHSNSRGVRQAPFTVLSGTEMPAVLVEIGYVTHAEEAKNLVTPSYLNRLANAISSGIVSYAKTERLL